MSMKQILELRQKRAGVVAQARALVETAESAGRDLTAEEQGQYDTMFEEIRTLGQRADRLEQQLALETELGQPAGNPNRPEGDGDPGTRAGRAGDEYRQAFESYMRRGVLTGTEERALQVDVDSEGGYLVPDQFINELIQSLDSSVFVRTWARTFQIPTADSLGAPALEANPADPIWTAEIGTGDEDSTMKFGARELRPHPLAKRIKVSRTLLRKAPGVEALVRDRLAYKFGTVMENAYLNGNGVNQPLGVFTASTDGIDTTRDVSTGNTTTALTIDGMINAKYALKQGYWGRARWLFHPDAVKQLVKIREGDGTGQYLWRESVRAGEPDTLLNIPVFMSDFAPNTYTSGLYAGILGDWSHYWIADALDMELQRLDELYSEKNQVGFIGRIESDGMPVLAEAFVRVKMATG